MATKEKSISTKLRRIGLWLLVGLLILLAGIYALRGVLIAPYAAAFLERSVAANLGVQISIGHLGGNLFSDLEARNVTTVKRLSEAPLADLQVRRLKLTYRLWDFFKGWQAFLAGTAVDIDGLRITLDLTAQAAADETGGPINIILPPLLPQVSIQDSAFEIKGPDYATRFNGISLAAQAAGAQTSRLRLQAAQWSLDYPGLRKISAPLEAELTYTRENLRLEKLLADGQLLARSAVFDLHELSDRIPFEAQFNLAGGLLAADGRLEPDRLKVALSGSDIDLSSISGLLAPTALPFGGHLTLKGRLDLSFDKPAELASELSIQVADGFFNSTPVEQLAFRFSADPSRLEIADLVLTNGPNRLSISRASVPVKTAYGDDAAAFLRSLKVEDWRLAAADVPAVLKLFGLTLAGQNDLIPSHRLILDGRMQDGNLIVPEGRLDADGGQILLKSADIELPIGERTLKDSKLAGDLSINLPDLQVLSRILGLPALSGAVQGQIKVSGTFLAPQGTAKISGRELTFRNRALGNLTVRAKGDLEGVTVESALLERGHDRAGAQGTFNLTQASFEGVKVDLAVSDLEPYFKDLMPLFLPPPQKIMPVRGGLKAAVNLAGPFTRPSGSLKLQTRQIRVAGTPLGDADIDLKFSQDKFQILAARLRHGSDSLDLSGSFRWRQKYLEGFGLKVAVADLAAYRGLLPAGLPGPLSGSLQGRLQAEGDLLTPQAEADVRIENLHVNDLQLDKLSTTIRSSGRLLRIEGAEAVLGGQRIELAADIRRNSTDTEFDLVFKQAAVASRGRTLLALAHEAGCKLYRSGTLVFKDLDLSGAAGSVSVNGRFEPQGASSLLISTAGLSGDGWLDLLVGDRLQFQGLNARIRFAGRTAAPSLAVEGTLDNIGSPGVPMAFAGRFNFEYGSKGIAIHQFVWQGAKGQLIQMTGTLPLDFMQPRLFGPGPLMLNGRIRLDDAAVLGFIIPWAKQTGGSVQCDLNLTGTWQQPAGKLHLAVQDLKRPADIRPLPPGPYTLAGDLEIDGGRVELKTLEAYSPGWKILANGQWRGAPTLPRLIGSDGRKLTGQLDLTGSLAVSDLSWVAREVDGVRRLAGSLEARGTLKGPITSPAADATVTLTGAEFAPDFDMPSLKELNLAAAVTPQALSVEALHGKLGGAPFELTGTWRLGTAAGSGADLRLRGENILLYRDESLRLRADTDLTLKGPLARLTLAGEIAVTDGRFAKNFGVVEGIASAGKPGGTGGFQLFSFRNPPLRDMVFDVRITAKEPFVIRNNLVRGSVRPDLELTGTGEIPLLVGKVYVESTRLYLPAGRMQMENGLVRFEKSDPDRPKLDLIGTSTMLGYDITAVVEGPYNEPAITLSSIPPLPNEELLMLLLAGQPPKTSTGRSNSSRQGLNIAVFLGRDFITRLFGSDSEDDSFESILDRFDVEVGRGITQSGEDTINSQFRIADDVFTENDSLYLTGERDYFDYYNGGVKFVFRFR